MEEIEKDMKKEKEQQENPVEAYCLSVASDLKMFNQMEQCMIKKEINDIIFKYQVSKFSRLSGQQTFGMSMGINPLSYSERTRDCFSHFLKQTGGNISDRVLNPHYVNQQMLVHQLHDTKSYKHYFELINHEVRS